MVGTKIVHTSGTFLKLFEKMSKNDLEPCSHIELNTQNPDPIFKITIYCTKYPNNTQILSIFWNILESGGQILKNQIFILLNV